MNFVILLFKDLKKKKTGFILLAVIHRYLSDNIESTNVPCHNDQLARVR